MLLATNFFFDPIVAAMTSLLFGIHHVIPSYGWTLIVLALVVRLALWPLSQQQFKSMAEMQKLQPHIKALQAKYKGEPQKLNTEMMGLYKEHGVNPFASCLPLLLQLPILISLFWAIQGQIDAFKTEGFGWIGSPLAAHFPQVFASSLAGTDLVLLGLYVISMYFSVRFGSPPSTDPQQAQTQKIMAIVSPAMIAYLGFRYQWASALILYWLAINIFTMAQQLFLYRRYGLIGPRAAADTTAAVDGKGGPKNVTPTPNGKTPANRQIDASGTVPEPSRRAAKRRAKR